MDIAQITQDLKLAFPVKWEERPVQRTPEESDEHWRAREGETTLEPVVWAYHTPISRVVFEANYQAIAAAHMALFSKGIAFALESGTIIATMALRDAARAAALESGRPTDDPAAPLLAEINRLTLILAPGPQGYEMLPVDVARKRNVIDSDDWKDAESSLVFFTCGWWMVRRERREAKRSALAFALRGSITSSSPLDFAAGLHPLTKAATSVIPSASSVPS